MKTLIILIIVIVLIYIWYKSCSHEYFDTGFNGIKPYVHVKLNPKDCSPAYYSWQSPAQNGELGCALVTCPEQYPDNMICWNCCRYV
jgi:hypothetical protein